MTVSKSVPEHWLLGVVSVNHKAEPYLNLLQGLHAEGVSIARLILCMREEESEREAYKATCEALARYDAKLQIEQQLWQYDSPTDHSAIYKNASETLKALRQRHAGPLAIHLSPGTPSMHAVWVLLGSTGYVDGEVELYQTTPRDKLKEGESPLKRVALPLDSWLKHWEQSPFVQVGDDTGHLFDLSHAKSAAFIALRQRLDALAPLRVPVLLHGERGVGKSTIANWLRARSPFKTWEKKGTKAKQTLKPMPFVVCGEFSASPDLARAELFGYTKGAFTGADNERGGLLKQADGDSLFLDEIGDLDRTTQRLLMGALEGRGFRKVGATETEHSTFRLICATNRSLQELEGHVLDSDFYDRIALAVVRLPALREVREDLPALWKSVFKSVQARYLSEEKHADTAFWGDLELLSDWLTKQALPGNLRGLTRLGIFLLSDEDCQRLRDALRSGNITQKERLAFLERLEACFAPQEAQALTRNPAPSALELPELADCQACLPFDLNGHLEGLRLRWFEAALKTHEGNQAAAARALRIQRKTLESQLKRLDLDKRIPRRTRAT